MKEERVNIIVGSHITNHFGEVLIYNTFSVIEKIPKKGNMFRNGIVMSVSKDPVSSDNDSYSFYYVYVKDDYGIYPYKVCITKKRNNNLQTIIDVSNLIDIAENRLMCDNNCIDCPVVTQNLTDYNLAHYECEYAIQQDLVEYLRTAQQRESQICNTCSCYRGKHYQNGYCELLKLDVNCCDYCSWWKENSH